jgi:hypothetical protein
MKSFLPTITIFLFLSQITIPNAHAQLIPAKMDSSLQSSKTIESPMRLEPDKEEKKPAAKKEALPVIKPVEKLEQRASYLHPGILVNLNGKWEGSDHLLNLSRQLGVYVTFIKPQNYTLDFTATELQQMVENIFKNANIEPRTLVESSKPPLPVFEIEVFVYPVEGKGFVAACQGRLFESVVLDRFQMDSNMAFQAITWEKQILLVSPKSEFKERIKKSIQEISDLFVQRYQAYERIKATVNR